MSNKSPFLVGVRDLVNRPGEMRERHMVIPLPERWGEGLMSIPAEEELRIDLQLESVHEGILVTADVSAVAIGECGRCLRPLTQDVGVEFQELFAYHSGEAFEHEVRNDQVDLEPSARDAVVLSLPFQPVCQPDCPGLDPETGERLERAAERSAPTGVDPRWSALVGFRASTDILVDHASTANKEER